MKILSKALPLESMLSLMLLSRTLLTKLWLVNWLPWSVLNISGLPDRNALSRAVPIQNSIGNKNEFLNQ
jgi:hypothetical protein